MLDNKVLSGSKNVGKYLLTLVKWIVFSIIMGTIGAIFGVLFHFSVDMATRFRADNPKILFLLPIAGAIIVFLYHVLTQKEPLIQTQLILV